MNKGFFEKFNLAICKCYPRHSVRFAKDYFKGKKVKVIEIGTFKGENAENLFKVLNIDKIFLIDPYKSEGDYLISQGNMTQQKLDSAKEIAYLILRKFNKDKVVWVRKHSNLALNDVERADFIYIDGNHTYKYVKEDIENYWNKLKEGGILAGHDITHEKFGGDILLAVGEFCLKKGLKPYTSRTDWWIVKK